MCIKYKIVQYKSQEKFGEKLKKGIRIWDLGENNYYYQVCKSGILVFGGNSGVNDDFFSHKVFNTNVGNSFLNQPSF